MKTNQSFLFKIITFMFLFFLVLSFMSINSKIKYQKALNGAIYDNLDYVYINNKRCIEILNRVADNKKITFSEYNNLKKINMNLYARLEANNSIIDNMDFIKRDYYSKYSMNNVIDSYKNLNYFYENLEGMFQNNESIINMNDKDMNCLNTINVYYNNIDKEFGNFTINFEGVKEHQLDKNKILYQKKWKQLSEGLNKIESNPNNMVIESYKFHIKP